MIDENPNQPTPDSVLVPIRFERQLIELKAMLVASNDETMKSLAVMNDANICHRKKATAFYEDFSTNYKPLLNEMIERDKAWAAMKNKAVTFGTRGTIWVFVSAFTAVFAGVCLALSTEVAAFARTIFHKGL